MSISIRNLNYIYGEDSPYRIEALKNINIEIPGKQFIGLIGHTGSGKSTLIQHLNGLIKASSGEILFHGNNIDEGNFNKKELRSKVGLVFQYPEHQLFEADVFSDVCFGPKNLGVPKDEIRQRAREAMNMVGLDESFDKLSPFTLSGGQKRRVAIAGVLAMKPEVLILDEPTAGLDPRGRDEILDQVARLHEEQEMTILLVSHNMEDIARYVERLIVMDHGEVVFDNTPREVFKHYKELEAIGLAAPQITYIIQALNDKGFAIDPDITDMKEVVQAILRKVKGGPER